MRKTFLPAFVVVAMLAGGAALLSAEPTHSRAASAVYPIEEGYGDRLTDSGIPRLVKDPAVRNAIIQQITAATALYGLPTARFNLQNGAAVLTKP